MGPHLFMCLRCNCYCLQWAGVSKETTSDFDPRQPSDRTTSQEELQSAVHELLQVFPDSCIGHLWGKGPQPPDVGSIIEVSTSLTLQQQAEQLVLEFGLYTVTF